MKVACIGNMNNNLFALVRYFRDAGLDTHLFLFDYEHSHFHPSADTIDLGYQKYTHQLSWGNPFRFLSVSPYQVAQDVEGYDKLVGCGTAPAFLNKINRALDLFVPYGTDIYEYPFFQFHKNPKHLVHYLSFSRSQRDGIRKVRYVSCDETNEVYERKLAPLRLGERRIRVPLPLLYAPDWEPEAVLHFRHRSHWYEELAKIRAASDLVVFHHCSQRWASFRDSFFNKGNDKLVRGFAEFVGFGRATNPVLIMVEYGPDVLATKRLVSDLGIEQFVRWLPQMHRKELRIALSVADIVTGEFGLSYLTYGVVFEGLASAKPVMQHRDDELYLGQYEALYPMIHADSSGRIAQALADYVQDPAHYKRMGEGGRRWFQEFVIERPLELYLKILRDGKV